MKRKERITKTVKKKRESRTTEKTIITKKRRRKIAKTTAKRKKERRIILRKTIVRKMETEVRVRGSTRKRKGGTRRSKLYASEPHRCRRTVAIRYSS